MPDREVRLAVLEALGVHGEAAQPVAAAIARQLDEPDSRLQQAATMALENIGGTTARQSLEARALRFAAADLARYGALRRAGDDAGLERFLRVLPSARQVVVARAMLKEDNVQIAYFGVSLLIRNGHEAETFHALVRIIATGGNDPSGPLHGRMGYDWVHSDDPDLARRMVQGIADHAGANLDTYPPDQRRRLEDFLKAGN